MKIGIMTFFRSINYGAYLQAYALSHRLNQEEDIEAEIIDFHMPVEDDYYKKGLKPRKNILKFIFNWERMITFQNALSLQTISAQGCCSNKIDDFVSYVSGKYDVIIAGSDEIWRVNWIREFPNPYFLPGDLQCKKISYAAAGMSSLKMLSDENLKLAKKYLDDFAYVGVRDSVSYEEAESILDSSDKLHINFDPVFVFDFKPDATKGRKLIGKYFHISGDKKIIVMMYSENNSKQGFLRYFKNKYQEDFDIISVYEWSVLFRNSARVSPVDLVHIIAAADGVVSMFFHGICIAMITGTPFFAIERRSQDDRGSKLYDLLNRLGLLDYYVLGVGNFTETINLEPFIKKAQKGEREDFSLVLKEAENEFEDFLDEIRLIYWSDRTKTEEKAGKGFCFSEEVCNDAVE